MGWSAFVAASCVGCGWSVFGEGKIFPHEEERNEGRSEARSFVADGGPGKTNLSQIFGLYPDPDNTAQEILESGHHRQNAAASYRSFGGWSTKCGW